MTEIVLFVTLEHLKTGHSDYSVPKVWPLIKKLICNKSTDKLTHLQEETKKINYNFNFLLNFFFLSQEYR